MDGTRLRALTMLCVLVFTGCTSDPVDDGASAPTTAASGGFAGEFRAITDAYNAQAEELESQLSQIPEGDDQRLLALVDELAGTAASARSDLAALAVPSEVADEVTTVLQLLDDQVGALDDLAAAVRAEDSTAFQTATSELIDISHRSAQARQRLDEAITACGDACR